MLLFFFNCPGQIFLSAADLWCQLLPFNGNIKLNTPLLFSFSIIETTIIYLCFNLILQQICHRDLKLENTLLDGSPAPRLKICDFGYSKVWKVGSYNLFIFIFFVIFSSNGILISKLISFGYAFWLWCSHPCCIQDPNPRLELRRILRRRFFPGENMMGR